MSTTASSALPSSLATLLAQYGGSSKTAAASESSSPQGALKAGGRLGTDPAFTLSLGLQDASSALVGYNRLAQLGDTFGREMAKLETPSESQGSALTVTVTQLATAQSLATSPIGDPDRASLGTGTLTIRTGTRDPDTGGFTAGGKTVSVAIDTGSLTGIAAAINAAGAGVNATVVEEGGGYSLHLTATATGAAHAFSLSGLAELAYDPAAPEQSALTARTEAQDAYFSVGGKAYASASNTAVPIAIGTRADFTATGTMTVPTSTAADRVQSLTGTFNAMQKAIIALVSKDGGLEKDANLAAGMFKSLGDSATAPIDPAAGSFTALADIGVTLQANGTLNIDPTALDGAITKDADGVKSLIERVSGRIEDAVAPYTGASGSLKTQVALLGSLVTRGGPSLIDYLNGGGTPAQDGAESGLAALLGGGSAALGNTAAGRAALASLSASLQDGTVTARPDLSALLS